jgi:hypothetical protein
VNSSSRSAAGRAQRVQQTDPGNRHCQRRGRRLDH